MRTQVLRLALPFWQTWIIGVLPISLGLICIPNKLPAKFGIHYPRWDLPARVFSATAMVLLITFSASILGSQWSGLLSPIPVLAWPLCAFVHHQQRSDAARAVLRGRDRIFERHRVGFLFRLAQPFLINLDPETLASAKKVLNGVVVHPSEDSSNITGTELIIDGGRRLN